MVSVSLDDCSLTKGKSQRPWRAGEADKIQFVVWVWDVHFDLCDPKPQRINSEPDILYLSERNISCICEVRQRGMR